MRQLDAAIFSALDALAVGTVYRNRADEGASLPCTIFFKVSGTPRYTKRRSGRRDAFREHVYVIKAVSEGDDQTAASDYDRLIDDAITDNVLDGVLLADGQGTIISCRRESDVEYEERDKGVTYQHVGAGYRIYITR